MSFPTCSRPDPSSKMGSSAVAVSSSVCIFPLATPSFLRTGNRQLPPRYRPKEGTSPAEQRARSPHPPQVGIQFHDGGACGKQASSTPDVSALLRYLLLRPAQCFSSTCSMLCPWGQSRLWLSIQSQSLLPPLSLSDRFSASLSWCSSAANVRMCTCARVTVSAGKPTGAKKLTSCRCTTEGRKKLESVNVRIRVARWIESLDRWRNRKMSALFSSFNFI